MSDGYVSEYLMEIALRLYNQDAENLIDFLATSESNNGEQGLSNNLIMGWSMEASEVSNISDYKLEIKNDQKISDKNKKYLDSLISLIDPSLFE